MTELASAVLAVIAELDRPASTAEVVARLEFVAGASMARVASSISFLANEGLIIRYAGQKPRYSMTASGTAALDGMRSRSSAE